MKRITAMQFQLVSFQDFSVATSTGCSLSVHMQVTAITARQTPNVKKHCFPSLKLMPHQYHMIIHNWITSVAYKVYKDALMATQRNIQIHERHQQNISSILLSVKKCDSF